MYKLTQTTSILRIADNAYIPDDPANRDYRDYLKWVAEGNTPEPADPLPPPAPVTQISPRQIRMALTQMSLRSQVEAAVAAGDQDLKDWYQFSTFFDRHHPQVIAMAAALNVDDQELDTLWALGATL